MQSREAAVLATIIITIDGPAGTGKSTVAHRLARRLGLDFLDTGAMYRAAALAAIESDIDPSDGDAVAGAIAGVDLHFDWTTDPPRLLMGGRDVSARVRGMDVSAVVSIVAAQRPVRARLVQQQRRIAQRHPRLVTEGRDQGSVVFPEAPIRFYLDADPAVRARRRIAQLEAAGVKVDEGQVQRDILDRDSLDSTRADGPLVRPVNGIEIDTSEMTVDQVVEELEHIVRGRLPADEFPDTGGTGAEQAT